MLMGFPSNNASTNALFRNKKKKATKYIAILISVGNKKFINKQLQQQRD